MFGPTGIEKVVKGTSVVVLAGSGIVVINNRAIEVSVDGARL